MNPNKQPQHAGAGEKISFFQYLLKNRTNKKLLLCCLGINAVLFLAYKYFFPLPDFFADSNGYVLAAANKAPVFYRPLGYSVFLDLVHDFSESHWVLITLQYLMLCLASLFCFFSIDYLFGFRNQKIKYAALLLTAVNPLLLPLANQVASDSLFAALTALWFTLLLWIIKKKSWWALILQVLVLYWAFQVRYNALYFPIIAAVAFLFSTKASLPYRIAGIAASVLVTFASYRSIKNITYDATGADVFTGFSGWQTANNALYIYKHIQVTASDLDDRELQVVDTFAKMFIDSIPEKDREEIAAGKLGSTFMWSPKAPLKQYTYYYSQRNGVPYFSAWYQVSEVFGAYGKELILQHPGAYFRYFIWNNTQYFFVPDVELLGKYNFPDAELPESTKKWFGLQSGVLYSKAPGLQPAIAGIYPYLHALLALASLALPLLLVFKYRAAKEHFPKEVLRLGVFWWLFFLANMGFSILSAVVALRYEAVWFMISFSMLLWFADQLLAVYNSETRTGR